MNTRQVLFLAGAIATFVNSGFAMENQNNLLNNLPELRTVYEQNKSSEMPNPKKEIAGKILSATTPEVLKEIQKNRTNPSIEQKITHQSLAESFQVLTAGFSEQDKKACMKAMHEKVNTMIRDGQ